MVKKTVIPIVIATAWISMSEFIRNQFLLRSYWTSHYSALGLKFPSDPVNGVMWGIWSLFYAVGIFILSRKFSMLHTAMISWFLGFVLMWVVIGNMGVLPYRILVYAIPLSLIEVFAAAWMIKKLS